VVNPGLTNQFLPKRQSWKTENSLAFRSPGKRQGSFVIFDRTADSDLSAEFKKQSPRRNPLHFKTYLENSIRTDETSQERIGQEPVQVPVIIGDLNPEIHGICNAQASVHNLS
jgi:hypothetical protein